MIINIGEQNSIFTHFIAEMRDEKIQKDSMRFRKNIERVGEIFAYEISKKLDYEIQDVKTPLGIARVPKLKQQPVLATILRAALPLHVGLLNIFDNAENAFISASRVYNEDGSFKIKLGYLSSPSVQDKVMILADPMLASGASMVVAYNALLERGTPSHTHVCVVIASRKGVDYLVSHLPKDNITLWIGAIDEELNSKAYIVPGLGDAGDLAYGKKL
jgi:uracil phosphoribosyltransferase